jgi:hypothetical protein
MAKYRLLRDASNYSYKTVGDTQLFGNKAKEIKDRLLYTIPKGTIIEAEPSKFNGGENEDFPNSFQVSIKKDSDKYPISLSNIRDVKNNTFFIKDLELVSKDSKVTLDKNLKVINSVEKQQVVDAPVKGEVTIGSAPTQQEPVSDLQYYTSANFLKRASVSIIPVGLIGAYCYHKKFSLLKSALLVSIPIVAITGLQYAVMGGGKNSYWGIFVPPSMKTNSIKQIK